ncbi:tRNA pseudouridine(13) synthase TruD [Marinomonas ostreistagni]|uniref:tRNA pseudouridine(13) synthase TruD n=1 Tax=Marinomonas ostreistagni TaxID=359209 RepID=UPI00194E4C98|nr:tRNA pseudouridine(13) synthase TruD [Marinomonas ostreistagni]MBM6551336.1 tRNA pseudouridine(13) synthase TruD [Marinomonas ostreistagni]
MNTDWGYAWTKPNAKADLKTIESDFLVEEVLGYEPDHQGEFVFLWIEKQGVNTDFLAKRLAQLADISPSRVTYAGAKDRHACTRQWFCLHILGQTPDFSAIEAVFKAPEIVRVLRQTRHSKKLKTGGLLGNRFSLRLRNIVGDQTEIEQRLALIKSYGVPNYYGEQRFGIRGNNLVNGRDMVLPGRKGTHKLNKTQSFWLSAIRSWFFNEALSLYVAQGTWDVLSEGDIAQPRDGSQSFRVKALSLDLIYRLKQGDISPVLPLISDGWPMGTNAARAEQMKALYQSQADLLDGLMTFGFARDSRATRIVPKDMAWELLEGSQGADQLVLQFELPKGAFATSVLRELFNIHDRSQEKHHETTAIE